MTSDLDRVEAVINVLVRERDTIRRAMVSPVYRGKLAGRFVAVCEELSRLHILRDRIIGATRK